MMNALIALGLGIVIFALIVGVGVVVLQGFAGAVGCDTLYTYNSTAQNCYENANTTHTVTASKGATNVNTSMGYLTSNLITWIPAIIALGVGLLFIGALMGRKSQKF